MFSAKVREKSVGKMRSMRLLIALMVTVVTLILVATAQDAWAVEFDEAEIFFEYNSTDQDLGIQIFFDAEGWKEVEVKFKGEEIFEVENDENLRKIGSTEVFTESAEPPLCKKGDPELCSEEEIEEAIEAFLALFPEGMYKFRGRTVKGQRLRGKAELTHDLLEPVELDLDYFPEITWTNLNPAGATTRVEVVVELVVNPDTDDEVVYTETATFPGDQLSYTVSDDFQDLIDANPDADLKVEILIDEESGNRTITEEDVD